MRIRLTVDIDPNLFRKQRQALLDLLYVDTTKNRDEIEGLLSMTDELADQMTAAGETGHEIVE